MAVIALIIDKFCCLWQPYLALAAGAVVIALLQTPLAQPCTEALLNGLMYMADFTSWLSDDLTMFDNDEACDGACEKCLSVFCFPALARYFLFLSDFSAG